MAGSATAFYGSLASVVLRGRISRSSEELCVCKCWKKVDNSFVVKNRSSNCSFTPTCKMRSRNSRAYQKKAQAKKISRERSSVDIEPASVDDVNRGPQNGVDPESGTDISEQPSSDTNGTSNVINNTTDEDLRQPKGAENAEALLVQPLKQDIAASHEDKFIHLVEDLMGKVKEAEKNILKLNQARLRTLEELEQARAEKDTLQGQMNVLQTRLAEADAKLKLAYQEKFKAELLEEEVKELHQELAQEVKARQVMANLETEYKTLQGTIKSLQANLNEASGAEMELEHLRAENLTSQEEINSLRFALDDLKLKADLITQLETEKSSLKDYVAEVESKVAQAELYSVELAKVRSEAKLLHDKVQKLEADLAKVAAEERENEKEYGANKALQERIVELQTSLAQMKAENEFLEQDQSESQTLQEKVKLLEQRLLGSDAEIRSQLEVYQAEVEAFQASLEQFRRENMVVGESVDDMPLEFWSHLLLCIDAWMLEKKIELADAKELRELAWRRDPHIKNAYLANNGAMDIDVMSGLLELINAKKRPGLHIVHIAAEMAPVAKVGGLGDVVSGLGKALQRKGHLVEVVLPKYDCMDYTRINNLKALETKLNSYFDGQLFKNKIWLGVVEGLPVYFIEPLHPGKLFWRGEIYGENDDFKRFTFFCRAALEFLLQANKNPDIIHCHDWHTAAVAPLYWDVYVPKTLNSARIAFTCHNFEYQGTESPEALASCGLNVQQHYRPDRLQDNFMHNRINLLKGGIVFSNIVTTVSPTYAQEVLGPEGGKGLHVTLTAHAQKFSGILNGIDVEAWNPATDAILTYQYSVEDLNGKAANKSALRGQLQLAGDGIDLGRPLVGCITRLVPQKGVHLIRHAIYRTLELGGQFILLGSSPIPHIQREFEAIAHQFNNHPHICLILKYDESLSRTIYAASDILVIPSIFEPCGLTQMIAMRYGTIPVARRTGGLNDSVFDVDDETIPLQRRNGFTFSAATEQGLNSALDRALTYYRQRSEWWVELVKKAMRMDFSWESSGDQYEELYQKAISRSRSRT